MKRLVFHAAIAFLVVVHAVDGKRPQVDQATAHEFSASASAGAVELQGRLLVPHANLVRGVIVVAGVMPGALGTLVYEDPAWRQLAEDLQCGLLGLGGRDITKPTGRPDDRPVTEKPFRNAAAGGEEALQKIMNDLARQSGHRELQDAKLVLWGGSSGGSFVMTLAALEPTRTIAFIRYHAYARGLPVDVKTLARIPALLIAGRKDERAGVEDSETFFKSGRALHAAWTFAIDPDATHMSPKAVKKANELTIPWIRAVFARRLSEGNASLRPVDDASGWFASNRDGDVAPAASFRGVKGEASWLPDEASAKGWRTVSGIQQTR